MAAPSFDRTQMSQPRRGPADARALFEKLFVAGDAAPPGPPPALSALRLWWTRLAQPPYYLRARASADGWCYAVDDLRTGVETPLPPADFDRRLAATVRGLPWVYVLATLLAVVWLVGLARGLSPGRAVALTLLVGLVGAAAWLVHARWWRLHVAFEPDRDARSRLTAVRSALASLRHCHAFGWYEQPSSLKALGGPLPPAVIGRRLRNLRMNFPVPSLACGRRSAHFLPDKILVVNAGRLRFVPYTALTVACDHLDLPTWDGRTFPDGEVVGRRWRFVTADGLPDTRVANNAEVPVLRLGRLRLDVGETRFWLLTSDPRAPERFKEHYFSTPAVTGGFIDEGPRLLDMHRVASGLGSGALAAAGALARWLRRLPARAWLVGGLLAALAGCVAVIIWAAGATGRELAQADRHWEHGDRAEAVALYVQHPARFWSPAGNGSRNLRRVIEYALERGDMAEARTWVERAVEHDVHPEFNRDDAKELYARLKAEHDRRLAEEEAQRQQRAKEEERQRRRPQEEEERRRREEERRQLAEQEEKDRAMMQEVQRRHERLEQQAREEERRRHEEEDPDIQRLEARAAPNLRYARKLIDNGMTDRGIERLREIVRDSPGTPSAWEARHLLRDLGVK
jgi:hypothetical protein